MGKQPTNGELAQMISSLREIMLLRFEQNQKDHDAVNLHLKTLNGQVAKNTKWRESWKTVVAVVAIVCGVVVPIAQAYINSKIII